MTRDEIEDGWPLVIRHYEAVVRFLDTRPTATRRKASRREVLADCRQTRDIRIVAAKHGVSPSVINAILVRAIRVALACERGKPPRLPRARKTVSITVTAVPTALVRDLDAWAATRGMSRREAALELWKAGLDILSLRAQRQAEVAFRVSRTRTADKKT